MLSIFSVPSWDGYLSPTFPLLFSLTAEHPYLHLPPPLPQPWNSGAGLAALCSLCCHLVANHWELSGAVVLPWSGKIKNHVFLILTLGCFFANEQVFACSDALVTATNLQRSGSHLSSCLAHMHKDGDSAGRRLEMQLSRVTRMCKEIQTHSKIPILENEKPS